MTADKSCPVVLRARERLSRRRPDDSPEPDHVTVQYRVTHDALNY